MSLGVHLTDPLTLWPSSLLWCLLSCQVAEARARKKKREVMAVKRAKAKAAAVMANPDMTEKEKMAAVRKAVKAKGGELSRPGKVGAEEEERGGEWWE
jgi:hypothetical protein